MLRRKKEIFELVTTQKLEDGLELRTYKVSMPLLVPERVWSVRFPATGETRECRRLRPLLWQIYVPFWIQRLCMDVDDYLYDLRHGFECSECGDEYRVFHTCQVNGR